MLYRNSTRGRSADARRPLTRLAATEVAIDIASRSSSSPDYRGQSTLLPHLARDWVDCFFVNPDFDGADVDASGVEIYASGHRRDIRDLSLSLGEE
jgi:hypothetical protein